MPGKGIPAGGELGAHGVLLREAVGHSVAVSEAFPAGAEVLEVAERPEDGKLRSKGLLMASPLNADKGASNEPKRFSVGNRGHTAGCRPGLGRRAEIRAAHSPAEGMFVKGMR